MTKKTKKSNPSPEVDLPKLHGGGRRITHAESVMKLRDARRDCADQIRDRLKDVDWAKRDRATKDLRFFIEEYCMGGGALFAYAPFAETDEIISCLVAADTANVPYHIRMTRGGGKTSLVLARIAQRIAAHTLSFGVFVGSEADKAQQAISDIVTLFQESDALLRDFPEIALPLRLVEGSPQRMLTQKCGGVATKVKVSADAVHFPNVNLVGACNETCPLLVKFREGAILRAFGFKGKIRGLRAGKLRPDFIVLDDLQDDEMAASPQRVEKARTSIYKTFFGLGTHKCTPSIMMTSTPILVDDLSEVFVRDPNWKSQDFPLMRKMPSGDALDLWRRYKQIQDAAKATGDLESTADTEYYLAHRAEMDGDAVPMWRDCFGGGEVSAIQHAMNLYLRDEESFLSEYQMKPKRAASVYEISPQVVMAATNGVPMGVVPEECDRVMATVDVMSGAGLRYAIMAFGGDRVSAVVAYGRFPADGKPLFDRKDDDSVKDAAVANALNSLLTSFKGMRYTKKSGGIFKISCVGVDAGWQTRIIHTEARKFGDEWCLLMKGVPWNTFNPYTARGKLRPDVISADEWVYAIRGKWGRDVLFHSDFWTETTQRGWFVSPLQSGSVSVFQDEPANLVQFAQECVADKLVSKDKLASGDSEVWKWSTSGANHFGDCVKMGLALAYWKRIYRTTSQKALNNSLAPSVKSATDDATSAKKPNKIRVIRHRRAPVCL